ncbi:DUF805 domain-containing protein [Lacibacter luteus]|uniref:DUF805 domain-containing protein n=1 Tax=Lacibacter luteus TaxID=2508719 RepID=A0A4Q1CLI2_9BACT|nr:DUF805 domain-containing protein [Lacibacter luteus]RXK61888.1 DUF805 domain-containing protein [Lacibacter luteus]
MEKHESNYNLFDWWKKVVFKNYANFNGRARRAEYWNFVLVNFIVYIPLYILFIGGMLNESEIVGSLGMGVLGIFALGMLIPSLAVLVRRLHDLNKSGWYFLMYFIPLVGPILMLVWLFTDGNRFVNNYGEDPKNPGIPELEFTGQ